MTTPKKVLVIDDEVAKRTAISEALRLEGLTVLEAGDGKEGLALALANHPQVILLDIKMPIMDGITMLKKLRADKWGAEATVLLFSSFADPENVREALQYGAQDFLLKSAYDLDEVVAQIKNKLR